VLESVEIQEKRRRPELVSYPSLPDQGSIGTERRT
jgi:hypothetical protein